VNGRKSVTLSGRLRNSTIFRCAKNRDSNSPRRKLPERVTDLSSGLIVHQEAPPAGPPVVLTRLFSNRGMKSCRFFPLTLWRLPQGQFVRNFCALGRILTISARCKGTGGLPLRISQAMLSGGSQSGAFCEHCSSPKNCAAILVELRSSRIGCRSYGRFEGADRQCPPSAAIAITAERS